MKIEEVWKKHDMKENKDIMSVFHWWVCWIKSVSKFNNFCFFFSKFNNFCFDFIRDREFMDFIELSRGQVSEDAGSKGNCQKYKNHSEKTEN